MTGKASPAKTSDRPAEELAREALAATMVRPLPDVLPRELVELGLSPYEARVLLALLQLGSANTVKITQLSGVPRTSTYQILESLSAKRVAQRLPGPGPAVWGTPGPDEVLKRLEEVLAAGHEQRLRQHRAHSDTVRRLLAEHLPETPSVPMPYVHILPGPDEMKRVYEKLLAEAQTEIVMFTRPPYAWVMGRPNPAVMDMLARGISTRVLYQADKWEEPSADAFRQEMDAYHRAGVQARLTDDLPIKIVVVDRQVALVAMNDPVLPEGSYPTALHVEHPGYAAVQAAAFEHLWERARPLAESAAKPPPP